MSDTTDSTEQIQSTPDAGGRGQLVNDGGDATLLLHEGTVQEHCQIQRTCVLQLMKDSISLAAIKLTRMAPVFMGFTTKFRRDEMRFLMKKSECLPKGIHQFCDSSDDEECRRDNLKNFYERYEIDLIAHQTLPTSVQLCSFSVNMETGFLVLTTKFVHTLLSDQGNADRFDSF